jgi:excisionase family DNA binding protein
MLLAQRLAEALEPVLLRISNQQSVRQDQLPPTMSVEEAAEFLGLGRNAVYDAVRTGQIAALRIGRRIRIPTHALLKKLESLS